MVFPLAWSSALSLCVAAGAALAEAPPQSLEAGAYDVEVRVEIPNVSGWRRVDTRRVCLPSDGAGELPVPVLSSNNPFTGCAPVGIERHGDRLSYDIVCAGRDSARAHASYRLHPGGFEGRVTMVLGAKNMTMAELQVGRLVGSCAQAAAPPP